MAKNKSTVYLGYEDEEVMVKHLPLLNSNVNKIGGAPDWPGCDIKVPSCPLCGMTRPLIVQIYAPLEQSQFHRTLYIFACLNPVCSQKSKSWLCIRTQHLETTNQCDQQQKQHISPPTPKNSAKKMEAPKISWCNGTDDWGTDDSAAALVEEMDTAADGDNQHEENGNVIDKNDNSLVRQINCAFRDDDDDDEEQRQHEEDDDDDDEVVKVEMIDDDDDESNSMENDIIAGFAQFGMQSSPTIGDPNANCGATVMPVGGGAAATAAIASATASATFCAEIENDESADLVLVETPQKAERDLIALLKHTPNTAVIVGGGGGPLAKITDVTLKSFFIAVDMETKSQFQNDHEIGSLSADHILELYQEYKRQDENAKSPNVVAVAGGGGDEQELYEKVLPAHGDFIFHHFISTIQQNPGQILRYSRNTLPLLNSSLAEDIPKCPNCNGETICEVQILPTLIPKLRLQQNNESAPIEYGNVLIFTCLKSCWDTPDKMRYERVIVQPENEN